jgi:hypothetical protein
MPKVLILPHYQYEGEFTNFLDQVNATQADFKFYLLPPESGNSSPLNKPNADYLEILGFLDSRKRRLDLDKEDLIIAFYDGVITALDHGLANLFIAGADIKDKYPCTAAVSLQFISWGILEKKYDYSLQRHALFHLVMCCLIGGYTKISAHHQTYRCLLDFNNQLVDFNRKLQMGYYLCSSSQSGCYNAMLSERYGNSIIRLCKALKNGIDQTKLEVIIKELVMGDKFEKISNSTIVSRSWADNSFNSSIPNIDLCSLAHELETLRTVMRKEATIPEHDIAIAEIAAAQTAAVQGNGAKALEHLKSAGQWAFDVSTKIGIGVAIAAIKTALGT